MKKLMAVLILTTLAVACSEQATAPQSRTPALSADFTNNPDVGNGVIYRDTLMTAVCWTDPVNGLRVCHRTLPLPSGDCGDFEPIGGVSHQDIIQHGTDDHGAFRLIHTMMGEVWITVRDQRAAGNCYGRRLIAEGWGNFHLRDNDVLGIEPGTHNANAWSYSGEGMLTAPDGARVHYNGGQHFVGLVKDGVPLLVQARTFVNVR